MGKEMKKLADQDEDIARTVAELPPEEAKKIVEDFEEGNN